jgi:2'-5' RNA ligase
MIRTFIALSLPESVKAALEAFGSDLKRSNAQVSWVRPGSIHLTLKFLGNVPEEGIEAIGTALSEVATSIAPFNLQVAGCGAFPTIKQIRVVWAGIRGELDVLQSLQKGVEDAMTLLGFKPEDRPFRPHLTLGRARGRGGLQALQERLMASQDFQTPPFDCREVVLYRSDLKPDGARYTPLFRAAFTGFPKS